MVLIAAQNSPMSTGNSQHDDAMYMPGGLIDLQPPVQMPVPQTDPTPPSHASKSMPVPVHNNSPTKLSDFRDSGTYVDSEVNRHIDPQSPPNIPIARVARPAVSNIPKMKVPIPHHQSNLPMPAPNVPIPQIEPHGTATLLTPVMKLQHQMNPRPRWNSSAARPASDAFTPMAHQQSQETFYGQPDMDEPGDPGDSSLPNSKKKKNILSWTRMKSGFKKIVGS